MGKEHFLQLGLIFAHLQNLQIHRIEEKGHRTSHVSRWLTPWLHLVWSQQTDTPRFHTLFWMDPFKTSFSTEKYYLRDSNAFLGEEGNKPFHQVNLIWFYISSNFYLHLCEDPFYSEMPCTRLRRNLQYHKEHRRPIF